MDLALYVNDARSLTLPLLGGNTGRTSPYGFHDWEFILRETKLLRYDHVLAKSADLFGTILMILAFIWGGYILLDNIKIFLEICQNLLTTYHEDLQKCRGKINAGLLNIRLFLPLF